jgi:hypothetical protein
MIDSPIKNLVEPKKDNTVIYLSPVKPDDRKSMTSFHLKANHSIAEVNEKDQWIEGSKLHDSDTDS